MRKRNILVAIGSVVLGLATMSCVKSTGNAIADSDSASGTDISNYDIYEEFKTASAAYVCEGDTTFGSSVTVYTTASISIQWPRRFGDANVKALQDTIMSHTFATPKSTIEDCIVDFISKPLGYGESTLRKVDAVPVADDNVRVLSTNTSVKTVGFCENYVVFKVEHDEYAGGAHPNYFASYVNYDLKGKQVLGFNDMFKANADEALMPILQQALLDKYFAENMEEVAEKSGIFTHDLYVSHEVYLTGEEIVFFYNPYEIGPWAIGTVEIPVSVANLTDYLTDEAKALYGLK